jgi:hypothetical protein
MRQAILAVVLVVFALPAPAQTLVFYPREGHGIQEYYHQKDRLTRIHAWLNRFVLGEGRKTTTQ